jgi:hypothetical protein
MLPIIIVPARRSIGGIDNFARDGLALALEIEQRDFTVVALSNAPTRAIASSKARRVPETIVAL